MLSTHRALTTLLLSFSLLAYTHLALAEPNAANESPTPSSITTNASPTLIAPENETNTTTQPTDLSHLKAAGEKRQRSARYLVLPSAFLV